MHCFTIAVALVAAAAAATALSTDELDAVRFSSFMTQFNKTYAGAENAKRFTIFQSNLRKSERMNIDEGEEVFGVTKFSDLTVEEFRSMYLMPKGTIKSMPNVGLANVSALPKAPSNFDWRTHKGAVTAVKDQGQCGSCWAFSATENIESVWALQGGNPLTELSVQQIVSCDRNKDEGCNGGDTPTAYAYVTKAGGLETEANYPYKSGNGRTGVCHVAKSKEVAKFDGFHYVSRLGSQEKSMTSYLATKAPLSICVDAETWQNYKSGVLKKSCGKQLDHCVMAVGYELNANTPYWIVRNSWNTDWGIDGYIYLEYGDNECGVAKEATSTYINK